MKEPFAEGPGIRTGSWAELTEHLEPARLELAKDGALLSAAAPRQPLDEAAVARLSETYEQAAQPAPRGAGAAGPRAQAIKQARQTFFTEHLDVEGPDSRLRSSMRKVKRNYRGNFPSPEPMIRNGRLLQWLGFDPVDVLARDPDFLTASIDETRLPEVERALQSHGLQLRDQPAFVRANPDTIGHDLAALKYSLGAVQLPLSVREVIMARPDTLEDSADKHALLVSLAVAYGSLRTYLAGLQGRGESPRGGEALRQKLLRDTVAALLLPPECQLLAVTETGHLDIAHARSLYRLLKTEPMRRSALLHGLVSPVKAVAIQPRILRMYFAKHPLTEEELTPELARYYQLEQPRPSRSTEYERLVRSRLLRPSEKPLVEALADQEITAEELEDWLADLNKGILEGSVRNMRYLDAASRATVERARTAFFTRLGWLTPGHPMYESFQGIERNGKGFLLSPLTVVRNARLLAPLSGDALLKILGVAHCRVARSTPDSNKLRLQIGMRRAAQQRKTLEEFIADNPYRFATIPMEDNTTRRLAELLEYLEEPYTVEEAVEIVPELLLLEQGRLARIERRLQERLEADTPLTLRQLSREIRGNRI